jgi:hypothetical protein
MSTAVSSGGTPGDERAPVPDLRVEIAVSVAATSTSASSSAELGTAPAPVRLSRVAPPVGVPVTPGSGEARAARVMLRVLDLRMTRSMRGFVASAVVIVSLIVEACGRPCRALQRDGVAADVGEVVHVDVDAEVRAGGTLRDAEAAVGRDALAEVGSDIHRRSVDRVIAGGRSGSLLREWAMPEGGHQGRSSWWLLGVGGAVEDLDTCADVSNAREHLDVLCPSAARTMSCSPRQGSSGPGCRPVDGDRPVLHVDLQVVAR